MNQCALGLCLFLLVAGAADDEQVTVRVDRDVVEEGHPFWIIVEARGANVEEPEIPKVPGLVIERRASRTNDQFTIVNRTMTQVKLRGYRATATRTGTITIPAVTVSINGKQVKSEPMELTVEEAAPIQPTGPTGRTDESPRDQEAGRRTVTLDDAVFATSEVDRREVYQGEPVHLTLSLWVLSNVNMRDRPLYMQYPTTTGFYAIPETPQEVTIQNRMHEQLDFRVTVQKQVLYPLSTGTLTVGPWEWRSAARVLTGRGFEQVQLRRVTEPIEITVRPLPLRPANFSGAVGTYTLQAHVTEKKVIQGTPTKLVVRVTGNGNPDAIGEPFLPDIEDAYIAPAEKETQSHPSRDPVHVVVERSFTYAITPLKAGTLTIPAVEYCYFDTDAKDYAIERVGPFTVEVLATPEQQSDQIVDSNLDLSAKNVAVLGDDIRPLELHPEGLRRGGPAPVTAATVVAGPVLAYCALAVYLGRRRRFESDTGLARSHRARVRARKRLAAARKASEPSEELYRAVIGFLADKFDVSEAGMTSSDAEGLLSRCGVEPGLVENLLKILWKCERARYAGDSVSREEVDALIHGAAAAVERLDAVRPVKPGERSVP
jgi:hypothetical protein